MTSLDHIFQTAADPGEAERLFQEFQKALNKPVKTDTVTENFLKIFGNSRFLSRFVIKNPEIFHEYRQSRYREKEKPLKAFAAEAAGAAQFIAPNKRDKLRDSGFANLKKYKYREYVRLTIKELLGHDQAVIYREFSSLARVIVTGLLKHLSGELASEYGLKEEKIGDYALIAMGKLGGQELNYSSDIDIIGLYDKDADLGAVTCHEFFVKLFTRLGQVLSQPDENGFFFRPDWDLRPEGRAGTLANALSAMEDYYEAFGAEWERQAYIKAGTLYQKKDVGDTLLRILSPWIYPKALDQKTIKNTWDMKAKIVQEWQKKSQAGTNIKLDAGGIRDIEFFVQGFQLLHGGKIRDLREPNTLKALDLLATHGLVKKEKTHTLKQSYLFLRRLESAIQMENEQQTHVIRDDFETRLKLARRMGFTQTETDAVSRLEEDLLNVRSAVKKLFDEVYGQ